MRYAILFSFLVACSSPVVEHDDDASSLPSSARARVEDSATDADQTCALTSGLVVPCDADGATPID